MAVALRLIVVDDEQLIRNAMKRQITKLSQELKLIVEIKEFKTGTELKEYVLDCDEKIDLIFTDEEMGDVSGSIAIQKIREHELLNNKEIVPIISVTSISDIERQGEILRRGASEIYQKPLSKASLRNILEKYISPDGNEEEKY